MVEMRDAIKSNKETEGIIHEYRQRLGAALEVEKQKLIEQIEQEASDVVKQAREESRQIVLEASTKTQEEASKIISAAQQKADLIIKEAERKAQDEAKDRTKREIEKILARGRDDAEKAVSRALDTAKKDADAVVNKAMEDADQIAAETKEKALKDSRKEAEGIVAAAHEEAAKITREAVEKAAEDAKKRSVRIISEAEQIAGQVTAEATNMGIKQGKEQINQLLIEVRKTLASDVNHLLNDTMKRVDAVLDKASMDVSAHQPTAPAAKVEAREVLEPVAVGAADTPRKEPAITRIFNKPAPAQETSRNDNERAPTVENPDRLYLGLLNLEIMHPVEIQQLLALRKCLLDVGNVHLVSTGGSVGKNGIKTVYTVDVKAPTPLIKLLKEMAPVESITPLKKQDIAIKLK